VFLEISVLSDKNQSKALQFQRDGLSLKIQDLMYVQGVKDACQFRHGCGSEKKEGTEAEQ
jgi:hypothetical protein